jgi:hypothetical protein
MLNDKNFWNYAVERAIKTAAQTATAVLGAGMVNILQIDLLGLVAVAGGSALLSLLTSIGGYKSTLTGK